MGENSSGLPRHWKPRFQGKSSPSLSRIRCFVLQSTAVSDGTKQGRPSNSLTRHTVGMAMSDPTE